MRAPDLMTAEDLISVPSPMTTSSSIITNGPMVTFLPIFALTSRIADGCIKVEIINPSDQRQ